MIDSDAPGIALGEIRSQKTAEVVAERLRRQIAQGKLKPGEFLPPRQRFSPGWASRARPCGKRSASSRPSP